MRLVSEQILLWNLFSNQICILPVSSILFWRKLSCMCCFCFDQPWMCRSECYQKINFKRVTNSTTTTKPFFTKWGRLEGNKYTQLFSSAVSVKSHAVHRMYSWAVYIFVNQEEYLKNFHCHKHRWNYSWFFTAHIDPAFWLINIWASFLCNAVQEESPLPHLEQMLRFIRYFASPVFRI